MYSRFKKAMAIVLCAAVCTTAAMDLNAAERDMDVVEEMASPERLEESSARTEENGNGATETQENSTEAAKTKESGTETAKTEESGTETAKTEESSAETTKTEENDSDTSETEESSGTEKTEGISSETEKTEESSGDTSETEESGAETVETEEHGSETEDAEETEDVTTETEGALGTDIETETIETLETEHEEEGEEPYFLQPGYIEDEFAAERLGRHQSGLYSLRDNIPAQYSAVEQGKVSSVKNQGSWGSCWAFAAVSAAESAYKNMAGSEADLSETHLINFLYNEDLAGPDGGLEGDKVIALKGDKVNTGGNGMYTTFALARWTGAADEAADQSLVYPSPGETKNTTKLNIPQELAYTDLVHMQNAYWINKKDTDEIKKAVMKYGSVLISYKDDTTYSSRRVDKNIYSGPTVYFNYNNFRGTGHAVSLVGWDDDFDRMRFAYIEDNIGMSYQNIPENNGAWLIKNSWGTEADDAGYFWMSYEDASIADNLFAFEYEKADNYGHIYQYDGSVGARYESGDTITAAAVYQSTGDQLIQAVGVGIASAQTDYTVDIYTGLSDRNDPQSGMLRTSVSGKTTFQGYHTICLDEYAAVPEGDLFSIVITLSNGTIEGGQGAAIFMDQSYRNGEAVEFVASSNPGETFFKNGTDWKDAVGKGTCRIKAYTSDGTFDVPEENRILTDSMLKEIGEQEYSSAGVRPEIELSYMGQRLTEGTDYSVEFTGNDKIADKASEDAPRAVITGIGKYTGTIEQTFTIVQKKITDDMVGLPVHIYNGAVQDDISVMDGENLLVKGTDYQIKFDRQPCKAGTYTATVTGTGSYTGEVQAPVTINKAALTAEMVLVPERVPYTGSAVRPDVSVMINGTKMSADSYSVSYKNNTNTGKSAEVTITGKGDCQGKVTKTFEICPRDISAELTVKVAKAVYTGKALQPSVTVKCGTRTLKKGRDYTVDYTDNVNASKDIPKAVITGTGNYTGRFEQQFEILPKDIAESSLNVQISYDDMAADDAETGALHGRVQVFAGKTELASAPASAESQGSKDALVRIYQAGTSTEAAAVVLGGKYDVQVTLQGNYKVKNKTAAIKKNIVCKKDIASLTVGFADTGAVYTYSGSAHKPRIVVTDKDGNTVPSKYYSAAYTDNVNAGTAQVTVTGKRDYTGTKQLEFAINRKVLDNPEIKPVKDSYTYTGKEITPAVRVYVGSRTLKAGKDYTCSYSNNIDVTYNKEGNVDDGACITVQFSDNYVVLGAEEGRVPVKFRIIPVKISALSLSKAYYTGKRVQPETITVKAGKLVVPQDCCEITTQDDINVSSKATITVTARPGTNYTGSRTQKYRIVRRELKSLVIPVIPDQPWLGKPVEVSDYAIKLPDGTRLDEKQYRVTMKYNRKPGTASAVYKAEDSGIYKGSVTVRFKIVNAAVAQAIDYGAVQTVEKPYTGEEVTLTDEELRQLAPIKGLSDTEELPYTAAYSRNVDAGTAAVCLTGKDYLHGSRTMYFRITPKSASCFKISVGSRQLDYDGGAPVYLEIKEITDGSRVLRAGVDYTVSYTNADKKGTACMAVSGTGNYSGTRYVYYNIAEH